MIFQKIKDSIYNPEFYREIRNEKFGRAFAYYYKLAFWIALISTIFFGFTLGPRLSGFLEMLNEKVLTAYPAGLEVTIKDGHASTNQATPTIIPLPVTEIPAKIDSRDNQMPANLENFLVIDTTQPFTLEMFKNYQTIALLTADSLVSYDRGQAVTIRSLQNWPSFVINQGNLTTWSTSLKSVASRWLLPLVLVGIFLLVFFIATFALAYLLVASLLVYLVAIIRQNRLTYSQAYRVSLHAITLPVIISMFDLLLPSFTLPPFLFTLILLLVVAVNLKPLPTPN